MIRLGPDEIQKKHMPVDHHHRADDVHAEEVAVDGVEYISPNQYGGRYGQVRRKYFSSDSVSWTAGATNAIPHGITNLEHPLEYGGYYTQASGTKRPANTTVQGVFSSEIGLEGVSSTNLSVWVGTGYSFGNAVASYRLWLDYTVS